jgi:hypothetical protein
MSPSASSRLKISMRPQPELQPWKFRAMVGLAQEFDRRRDYRL